MKKIGNQIRKLALITIMLAGVVQIRGSVDWGLWLSKLLQSLWA